MWIRELYSYHLKFTILIDPEPESDSPICEEIMDRVIHNAYEILVDVEHSMRERYGLKAEEIE